jgi:serine O-acetyltransferase
MEQMPNFRRKEIVDALVKSYHENAETIKIDTGKQINRLIIIGVIERLQNLIFPGYFCRQKISAGFIEYHAGELVEEISWDLRKQIARALNHRKLETRISEETAWKEADDMVYTFMSRLPHVRDLLATDVDAFFDGDPAAFSKDEIISSYPGIYAIMVFRLAHELHLLRIPLIPRVMTEHAHSLTGIDIHPGAEIGRRFFIDHGTGIVIGETTVIGDNVKIYQGVTLGGLSTRAGQALKTVKRHPTIGDNVTIYSGASILGGATVIETGAVIGSNAFITTSVPAKTKVSVKNPELQYKADVEGAWSQREFKNEGFLDYMI